MGSEPISESDDDRAAAVYQRAMEIAQSRVLYVPLEMIMLVHPVITSKKRGFENDAVELLVLAAYLLGRCDGDLKSLNCLTTPEDQPR